MYLKRNNCGEFRPEAIRRVHTEDKYKESLLENEPKTQHTASQKQNGKWVSD